MHSGSKTTKNSMEFPTLPVVNEGRAANKTLCFIKPSLLNTFKAVQPGLLAEVRAPFMVIYKK